MSMKPEVSVICTARNAARTIAATLDSIMDQKGMPYWEMIVVDDGSTDDTASVGEAYQAREPRLRLFRLLKARGRAAALNVALRIAKADLVANIDADDVAHPRRLRLQHANMLSSNIDVLGTAAIPWRGQIWPGLGGLMAVFLLVLANGFFVATEFAIVAVRKSRLEELERDTIQRVFEQVQGDKARARKMLGISRATLYSSRYPSAPSASRGNECRWISMSSIDSKPFS